MLNLKKYTATLLAVLFVAIGLTTPVFAQNEVNFLVTPHLPDNQRPGTEGYFDLILQPGEVQQLTVEVVNRGTEDIAVEVEAITASTNLNGVVNYTTPGEHHSSLPFAFSDCVALEDTFYTIPAGSSKLITITASMPEETYEGYLLGSIHVKKQLTEEELRSGQTIVNQYSYVIAVKLAQSEWGVSNDFALDDVQAELVNGRASIVNYVANPQAVLVKGMRTNVRIVPTGSDVPVMEQTVEGADMAPNSIFPLTLVDDSGYGVKAGTYRSLIDIEYNGQTWNLQKDFTIEPEQAAAINNNAIDMGSNQTASTTRLPGWVTAAIILGIVLFLAMIVLLVYLIRRVNRANQGE